MNVLVPSKNHFQMYWSCCVGRPGWEQRRSCRTVWTSVANKVLSFSSVDKSRRQVSGLLQRHALLGQFLFCFLVLGQVHQAHATQHIGRLGELDIVVTDDLDSVAPGVPKIKERTIE